MDKNSEKSREKSKQSEHKILPTIVAKPGGKESGTELKMFEKYQKHKKRELKND